MLPCTTFIFTCFLINVQRGVSCEKCLRAVWLTRAELKIGSTVQVESFWENHVLICIFFCTFVAVFSKGSDIPFIHHRDMLLINQ